MQEQQADNVCQPADKDDDTHTMAKEYIIKLASGEALSAQIGEKLGGAKLWSWQDGEEKVFTVRGPIRKGTPFRKSGIQTAPDLLDVTDLATGEDKTLLAGKVLVSTLTENFPDDGYVGRSFRAVQGPPPAGKRYKSMEVFEVTITGPADDEPKKSRKK